MSLHSSENARHPAGYQAPDVQCKELTIYRSHRLLANDPVVRGLFEHQYDIDAYDDEDRETIRRAFSSSTHLRMLKFERSEEVPDHGIEVRRMLTWIAENRSIEHLILSSNGYCEDCFHTVDESDVFEVLAPFFENNFNLRCIEIDDFCRSCSIPYLIAVLPKMDQLERLDIRHCEIGDEMAACLVAALNSAPSLVELGLSDNGIGMWCCKAFGILLTNTEFKIHLLDLGGNGLDDKCIEILANALIQNSTIRVLHLHFSHLVTSLGWSKFSAYLSNSKCSLHKLVLSSNDVAHQKTSSLVNSLALNNTLKCLDFQLRSDGDQCIAWHSISPCFRSPNSALERLDIELVGIDDEGAPAIALLLAENTSLKALDISGNSSITSAGWIKCFQLLINSGSASNVESLSLCTTNIDNEGATLLANWLAAHTSLKELDLSDIRTVTASGWVECFRALADSQIALEKLNVMDTHIDDEGVAILIGWLATTGKLISLNLRHTRVTSNSLPSIADVLLQTTLFSNLKVLKMDIHDDDFLCGFATALAQNTSLEVANVYFPDSLHETWRCWRAIENALCDHKSIDTIYYSNHTLHTFSETWMMGDTLCHLFETNSNKNKAEVVRTKILEFYFSDVANIRPAMDGVAMSVLPTAIAWIAIDRLGFSTLYYLLHDMPSRFVCNMP
ncbi:hypothetical protein ACHAWU_004666 [Discostella pseudostelligera]|uniref:Uncharacterized protein n=1 Tax=Discostella pseudostelligera TaxID=259834 RepID=A0ABD3N5L9_9STRA